MIIIIGGTSGIGLETAKYLQSKKYDILISGRNDKNIDKLKYEYIDVSNDKSIQTFFSKNRKIDGLIYSAGITTNKTNIANFDSLIYDDIMNVNVKGLLLCLKYSFESLKKYKTKIVVLNSLASRTFSKFSGVEYTISKSAISGLVKHLAIDFAKDGILINSIFPSMTETPMLLENVDKDILDKISQEIPLGRIAKPLEIAKAIEFLISKDNTYMTGCGLDLNGGQFLNG